MQACSSSDADFRLARVQPDLQKARDTFNKWNQKERENGEEERKSNGEEERKANGDQPFQKWKRCAFPLGLYNRRSMHAEPRK